MDRTVPACAELADFLRARRKSAGLTYREMSQLVQGLPSPTTLERAASGNGVPAWETVQKYVLVTTTEDVVFAIDQARRLWLAARRAKRAPYYVHKAPDPSLISDRADFSRALRDQHTWAGSPSPGEMEAVFPGLLPKTTVYRIIKGTMLPVTPYQAEAFLAACEIKTALEMEPWFAAAARVFKRHQSYQHWAEMHFMLLRNAEKEHDLLRERTLEDFLLRSSAPAA